MKTRKTENNLEYLEFDNLSEIKGIRHFVSTRCDASDGGPYSSFNMCDYTGDSTENVLSAREKMASELGVSVESLIMARQVHGTSVCIVDDFPGESNPGEFDALICSVTDKCIMVSTADCVPIILYDPVRRVAAAVHCGWRGTVARLASLTVAQMSARFGSEPSDIIAGIGPSISVDNFEVGQEVIDIFKASGFDDIYKGSDVSGKGYIDLWQACRQDLVGAGLLEINIQISGICTFSEHERFFSARRLGIKSGRISTGIMIMADTF